ncbi:MAG: hypothetical protein HY747_06285 [Elusimicrobia bacterium]|nr:hypothetical protein [Elusimicrobiota bacterium]
MSKFNQYPHIENLEDVPAIFGLPEVIVTEKVHGSNMRIAVLDGKLHLGGRKLEFEDIRPDTREGLCFIQWVLDTGLDKKMIEAFAGHDVILFGEWHGSGTPKKNWPQIQKGIKYIKGNDLRIFDVKVNGRYVSFDEIARWASKAGLKTMPVLYRGKPDMNVFNSLIDTMSKVGEENGIVDPENTIEGLVIRPSEFTCDEKGNPVMAKLKIGKWAERASQKRGGQMPKQPKAPPAAGAKEFAEEFVTDTRLSHVLDQLRQESIQIDKTAFGHVMRLMGQDVKREGAKALESANLDWKDVSQHVSMLTKKIFSDYLQKNSGL